MSYITTREQADLNAAFKKLLHLLGYREEVLSSLGFGDLLANVIPPSAEFEWKQGTPWSTIWAQLKAAGGGTVNLVDDNSGNNWLVTPGSYAFANVIFKGNYSGLVETQSVEFESGVTITDGAVNLDGALAVFDDTCMNGIGPNIFMTNGSYFQGNDVAVNPFATNVPDTGATLLLFNQSFIGGGSSTPFLTLANSGAVNGTIAGGSGFLPAFTFANLVVGAVTGTANFFVDATFADTPSQYTAQFGAGITATLSPTGNAFAGAYVPTTPGNWSSVPANLGAALDTLAAHTLAATNAIIWKQSTAWSTIYSQITANSGGVVVLVDDGSGNNWKLTAGTYNLAKVRFMGTQPTSITYRLPPTIEVQASVILQGGIYLDYCQLLIDAAAGSFINGGNFIFDLSNTSILSWTSGAQAVNMTDISLRLSGGSQLAGSGSTTMITLVNSGLVRLSLLGGSFYAANGAHLADMVSGTGNIFFFTVDGSSQVRIGSVTAGAGVTINTTPTTMVGTPAWMPYTPGTAGNWSGSPTNIGSAIDRIAAAVYALRSNSPIP